MEQSDSREKLFDSSLTTVNVSVNTELPIDFSYGPKEENFDYLHFYGEMDDDVFHKMMSVDDLKYSILFSDEDFDNGEWHTYAGLETCDVLKPTRHGNELLGKSIQSATERGDSGIDNIAYLSGADTGGTGHTQVYESSDNMLVTPLVRIRVNLIWIWKMTSFLMMKSIQTLMMESIFQQMKVLKGL